MKDWMWVGGLGWWGVLLGFALVIVGFAFTGFLPGGTYGGGVFTTHDGHDGIGGPLGFLGGWVLKLAGAAVFTLSFINAIGMAGAL
ncbi:hypothetical protein GCM10011321_28210 [Youhaiella tibetensis]|uniref:Uncharacterized protein n=1 Tax=Paradevosia tibetensis TaxID=1447062 RepID=A0A5B9DJ63_9HYPH|nr:hypothetical protein [Youhaiella tibetensis]QEE19184.1 hypothetical protein FNA67_02905 [Youhaiella tibetensis]GGF35478.1 hypothetical protein GCM10011321_28210 [Youhaiella tibetensis]